MPKRNYDMTQKKYHRLRKVGRGKGVGSKYKSFLTGFDFSSIGNTHRFMSWLLKRRVNLFSDNEYAWFCYLEQLPSVIDIREQFPLTPPNEILNIVAQCDHKYYTRLRNRELTDGLIYVPTIDFLVTMKKHGHVFDVAFTVKPAEKLTRHQVLKFEIERRYLQRRGIGFFIITDTLLKQKCPNLFKNIDFLRPFRNIDDYPKYQNLNPNLRDDVIQYLTKTLLGKNLVLRNITDESDQKFRIEDGTSLLLANHCIANQNWRIDMLKPYNPTQPVTLIETTNVFDNPQNK